MKDRSKRLPVSEQIRKGLEEAIRHARGEIALKTTVLELPDPPPEVRAEELTRLRLDRRLSQADFARLLNVSTRAVQGWERGASTPKGAALRLIQVLRQEPAVVLRVAGMTRAAAQAGEEPRGAGARAQRATSAEAAAEKPTGS